MSKKNIDIEKIAELAKLEIDDERKEKIAKDLSDVLAYVDKLKEVDTSKVDYHSNSPLKNRVREDKVKDTPEKEKEKMRSMGKSKDDYFQVESI